MGLTQAVRAPLGDGGFFTTTAVSITPTIGPDELITNGNFAAWTDNNPDSWTVVETAPDPEVTQVGTGEGHGGAGTGCANFYSSATTGKPNLWQVILTVGKWYWRSAKIDTRTSGDIYVQDNSNGFREGPIATIGTKIITGRALGANLLIQGGAAVPINITIDDVSVKELSTTEQLFSHPVPYGDFSIDLTAAGTLYQGGVIFNRQDASNYAQVYFNRIDGKVCALKVIAGTTTQLGSWSATYAAGKTLTARRHKNGTLDVIYNGVTLASGLASTGLAGVQAGPFLTDATGVTISRYTWDARRAS